MTPVTRKYLFQIPLRRSSMKRHFLCKMNGAFRNESVSLAGYDGKPILRRQKRTAMTHIRSPEVSMISLPLYSHRAERRFGRQRGSTLHPVWESRGEFATMQDGKR